MDVRGDVQRLAMAIVAEEQQRSDEASEPSCFSTTDFRFDGTWWEIEFEDFIPASGWFGCLRTPAEHVDAESG